ncbi:MAG: cupredoxin domain-containing protein [Chloroflexi bacterium]|nr:cupredoxin domain-containing protein [Chloroflexota bacterium]
MSMTALSTTRRLALLVLLGATGLACEYPGVAHPLAGRAEADGALVAAPPAAGLVRSTSGPRATPSQAGLAQSGEVTVGLKDFFLDPDRIVVKAGNVVFHLVNGGRYTHDFRVEGNGVDEKAPKLGIGHSLRWEIALAPGTYAISCPISNHADRGMNGTLVVE